MTFQSFEGLNQGRMDYTQVTFKFATCSTCYQETNTFFRVKLREGQ